MDIFSNMKTPGEMDKLRNLEENADKIEGPNGLDKASQSIWSLY